ncbi:DUF4262 domain-containing protein [Rhodococcus sovatensis]|uniref:DUF4262 domain-containing protein n=1 Tax=Rhodococcus sovatensis TaxID=1805840 RepID=A0ABZ2PQR0_9NOCA
MFVSVVLAIIRLARTYVRVSVSAEITMFGGDGGVMCAMCDGRSIEDYVVGVEGLIDRYGWALQYVSSRADAELEGSGIQADDGDDRDHLEDIVPAFCYTVGLTAHGHPELILTGRSAGESASVLNVLARRILFGCVRFEAGTECSAGGFELSFVDVAESEDWLLMACRIYSGDNVSAVQAVWRDSDGNLPWEGDFPSSIVQPVLGPPPGWYDEFD